EREGEGASGAVVQVDELVLDDSLVRDREATGHDDAARRERGEADLGRTTFDRQPPRHDCERALSLRGGGRRGQREPRPETVISALVVELDRDPRELFARAQLD